MTRVLVLIGSDSDREYFEGADQWAAHFGFELGIEVISAHRDGARLRERLSRLESEGTEVIVAGAGMAAHLAGVCAAETNLPVIGVPLPGSSLGGLDALLSTVQMPSGVPVATVSIGKAGAKNAVVLAARILALKDKTISEALRKFKARGFRL
ncbi:5-(carboxyamino)imidazole ribonucleotide mutase [bacterium]|nr:5-(carboxyamino)imidazole ribonucleotide mutase [bacterium]